MIVLAITSQIPAPPGSEDYRLSSEEQQAAHLPKPSIVKCGKVLTLDQRLIRKVLGRLPEETLQRLKQQLLQTLG